MRPKRRRAPPDSPETVEQWHTTGSDLLGLTLSRPVDEDGSLVNATVISWLPASESDFLDDDGKPAALYKIRYLDGALAGDHEDLEAHEVEESIPAPDEREHWILQALHKHGGEDWEAIVRDPAYDSRRRGRTAQQLEAAVMAPVPGPSPRAESASPPPQPAWFPPPRPIVPAAEAIRRAAAAAGDPLELSDFPFQGAGDPEEAHSTATEPVNVTVSGQAPIQATEAPAPAEEEDAWPVVLAGWPVVGSHVLTTSDITVRLGYNGRRDSLRGVVTKLGYNGVTEVTTKTGYAVKAYRTDLTKITLRR